MAPPPEPPARPRDLVTDVALALRGDVEALPDTADPRVLSSLRARHPQADPSLISALATQVRLQRRAGERLGSWAQDMVLEEEALQQATRRDVARYRAQQIAQRLAADRVADVGCGIGVDARALAEAGFTVLAIERDPWRAEAAAINLARFSDRVDVMCADATAGDPRMLDACDAAYVDPARRAPGGPQRIDGGRSRATPDPAAWSPPWPWVLDLSARMPVVAKVAPGFDARHAPPDSDLEWIDHGGETVEATAWLGDAGRGMRRAVVVAGEHAESIDAPRASPPASGSATEEARRLLLEPTPAVVHARLIDRVGERLHADRLDGSGWLTADDVPATMLVRAWQVLEEVPYGARELNAWLRGRGSVTWKTADARVSAAAWDRRVGHRRGDGPPVTVVITGQGRAFAVERATS